MGIWQILHGDKHAEKHHDKDFEKKKRAAREAAAALAGTPPENPTSSTPAAVGALAEISEVVILVPPGHSIGAHHASIPQAEEGEDTEDDDWDDTIPMGMDFVAMGMINDVYPKGSGNREM